MLRKRIKTRPSHSVLGILGFLSVFLILVYSEVAIESVRRGMELCAATVIPSLFPFMVASELVVSGGGAGRFCGMLGTLSKKLFGVSSEGASSFLLGTLCGFPVGTRSAVGLFKRGAIGKEELLRLICFSNSPSSAFVINAVGATLFGNKRLGIVLYVITLLSSVTVGIAQKFIFPTIANDTQYVEAEKKASIYDGSVFAASVTNAATAMLHVCAFVVFFSVIGGVVGEILSSFGVTEYLRAVIFSFLELTGGVSASAALRPLINGVPIAAFALGWSGFSVHLQIISICSGCSLRFGRYFLSKLLSGVINVILICPCLMIFGKAIAPDSESMGALFMYTEKSGMLSVAVTALFLLSLLLALIFSVKRKIKY